MRLFLCAAALAAAGCTAESGTVDEALSAYGQNRVGEAEATLRKVAADPAASAADKGRALRELARIAWLIDGKAQEALALLARTDANEAPCEDATLRARILQESEGDATLVQEAGALAARCSEPHLASELKLRAASAALDVAAANPAARAQSLAAAKMLLDGTNEDVRGSLTASAIALEIGLLEGDAKSALKAWKDYFWLTDDDMPQGMKQAYPAAAPLFEAGLAPGAAPDARLQLVDLVVRAGFAEAARRFAEASGLSESAQAHPLWRKASAYFAARRELEAAILASNRRVARGGEAADLNAATDKAVAALMAGAGLKGDVKEGLRRAYGLHGQVGDTNGHLSVHYGHVVQDERRAIEQYGHRVEVAFMAVDNMISNGFSSWLWDGTAAVGGWASPGGVIVQVRTGFTSNPVSAWSLFSGGTRRQKLDARRAEKEAADIAKLKETRVAYLPGLADRLQVQLAEQVGARARAAAGDGAELRRAFLAEYSRATFQSEILCHEGRHALDRRLVSGLARLSDANLEYRAKLSALALADYPRVPLININDQTVGDGTGHGTANARILRAYAEWIDRNRAQVKGFDPAVPAMVQIDRLTDDQIRAVARSLDPIAQ